MFPWKMVFRSFSAMVLFLTGGFAAGQELPLPMPFESNPTEVVAPAPPSVDESTTTTTTDGSSDTPAPDAPPALEPPVADTPPAVEPVPAPDAPAIPDPAPAVPAPPVAVPAPAPAPDTPPAAPVDPDAPAVCVEADTAACGPAPAADNSHAARVERCTDWWNSLAQAFADNGRPEWAARATKIAGRCEAMITRWEQWEQRWRERQARQDRVKGDHNGDGRPDEGWHQRDRDDTRDGRRSEPRTQKASRHREGR